MQGPRTGPHRGKITTLGADLRQIVALKRRQPHGVMTAAP